MHNPYALAPEYFASGIGAPLPLPHGQKTPPPAGYTGKDPKYGYPDVATVRNWIGAPANIALRPHDGVVGIDVDVHDEKHGDVTLAAAVEDHGSLPNTWKSSSREGVAGIYWFTVPTELKWPDSMGKDIEVIHPFYRYGVVPPSVHPGDQDPETKLFIPGTHRDYFWTRPDGSKAPASEVPGIEDLAPLPDAWVEWFLALKAKKSTSAQGKAVGDDWSTNTEVEQLPGTDFNRRADWAKDILEPAGWKFVKVDSDGSSYWQHPTATSESSATIGKAKDYFGNDALFVHTSSTAFKDGETYNAFAAYAILIHKGDYSVAAKALARRGFGRQEVAPDLTKYQGGDVENARLFAEWYGDGFRWVPERKSWHFWSGQYWEGNADLTAQEHATQLAKRMNQAGFNIDEAGRRKFITDCAKKLREQKGIFGTINMAKPALAASTSTFDTHPYLLNVKNGTLDLQQDDITKVLKKHDRKDLLTTQSPWDYQPTAACPTWEAFLARATNNDPDMLEYIQKFVGYCLTGDVSDKSLFFIWGITDSGKTQFVEAVRSLLGLSYTTKIRGEALLQKPRGMTSTNNDDIADLEAKRFATISELRSEDRLDIGLIKDVTGGGLQRASRKYEKPFQFIPQAKILIDTNHKPQVIVDDVAFWNRVRLIEFNVQIPKHEQNKHLQAKFHAEMSGILAWAVRGWYMVKKEGFDPPRTVTAAVEAYRAEEDWFADFLEECCNTSNRTEEAKSGEIYGRYVDWAKANGVRPILSNNMFGRTLLEKGFEPSKHHGTAWRVGITLRPYLVVEADQF